MRRWIHALLLLTLLVSPLRAEDTNKVVFHINEPEKMALLVDTVRYMREHKPDMEIAIVVNGPAVTRMTDDLDYARTLLDNSDWLGACSVGLLRNAMSRKRIAEGVVVIEQTGVSALINFRRNDYTYIKI